jgi:hypothetical protein
MRFRGTPTHLHTYVKNDPRDEIYNMIWPIHFVNADRPGYRVPEFLWSFRIYYLKKKSRLVFFFKETYLRHITFPSLHSS